MNGIVAARGTDGLNDGAEYSDPAARHVSITRVFGLFQSYAGRIALILGLVALATATGLAVPLLLREIIEVALPRGDVRLLGLLAGSLVGLAAVRAGIGVLQAFATAKVGQTLMHDLRGRMYANIQWPPLGVLLLDEATSALDTATEQAVVEALARPGKARTTITIAYCLSTVRRVDQIVVLVRGTVVESGTQETLLACDGASARLVRKAA